MFLHSEEVNPAFGYRKANHHVFAWYLAQFPGCETRHENIRSQLHLITRKKRSGELWLQTRRNRVERYEETLTKIFIKLLSMIYFYNKIKRKCITTPMEERYKDVFVKSNENYKFLSFHFYKYREEKKVYIKKLWKKKLTLFPVMHITAFNWSGNSLFLGGLTRNRINSM